MNLRSTFSAIISCCRCGTTCCLVSFFGSLIVAFFALLAFFKKTPGHELEFTVTDASLAQFDFTAANSTLAYSLAMNITVQNPNTKGGLFFDRFQVSASYRRKIFALAARDNSTTPFYLGRKNATVVSLVLEGRLFVLLEESDVERYESETNLGVYSIDAKLDLRLRNVRLDKTKSYLEPPKISCDKLRIPLRSAYNDPHGLSTSSLNFEATKCTKVYIFTSPNKTTYLWP